MLVLESSQVQLSKILKNAQNLIDVKEKDILYLRDRKDILTSWADELMDDFYDTLLKYPKTAKVFEKVPVEVVKEKNKNWYKDVVSGKIDENFYKFQFFVGLVHVYWNIENNIMIFMANRLKMKFLDKASKHFEPQEATRVFHSFSKIVDFLIALTVEGFIFTLKEALFDIAGLNPNLVKNMMGIKLDEMYDQFKTQFEK